MGSAGLDRSAQYIAGYFRALGLQPPRGQDGYFQAFVHPKIPRADKTVERPERYELKNVAAVLRGRGAHADQYIVIGAHYDHLGRGLLGGGPIHNGADDNASGVAAMLELARLFAQGPPLKRSLLFVAFSAEEHGLVGSRHWIAHPPVPRENIVAMINLDMLGRVRKKTLYVGGVGTSPAFAAIVRGMEGNGPLALSPLTSWSNGMAPSDSAAFAEARIPTLLFWSGTHADMHRPTDDVEKINFEAEAQAVDAIARIIRQVALRERLPFSASPTTQPAVISSRR